MLHTWMLMKEIYSHTSGIHPNTKFNLNVLSGSEDETQQLYTHFLHIMD